MTLRKSSALLAKQRDGCLSEPPPSETHVRPRPALARPASVTLFLEALEDRVVPSVTIEVNYSLDTVANGGSGFFQNNPSAVTVMNQVALQMGQRISANLAAIDPSGSNTWTAYFASPETGAMTTLVNLNVPANTIVVYVGAGSLAGNELGYGDEGGDSWSGSGDFGNAIDTRDWQGFSQDDAGIWGGSIEFSTTENWYFGLDPSGLQSNQIDFYSVAMHELSHVLGLGTSPLWMADVSGTSFTGPNSEAVYGGPVPLASSSDLTEWQSGLTYDGQLCAGGPSLPAGERMTWTALDQAALEDVGWGAGATVPPPAAPPVSPPPPAVVSPPVSPPPIISPPVSPPPVVVLPVVPPVLPPPVVVSPPVSPPPVVVSPPVSPPPVVVLPVVPPVSPPPVVVSPPVPPLPVLVSPPPVVTSPPVVTLPPVTSPPIVISPPVVTLPPVTSPPLLPPTTTVSTVSTLPPFAPAEGAIPVLAAATAVGATTVLSVTYSNGTIYTWDPFGSNYTAGATVALGDVTGDGVPDIVVASGASGTKGTVEVYSGVTRKLVATYTPYGAFGGGLDVAVGDVNGSAYGDIIVGVMGGGYPWVTVISGQTGQVIDQFLAYPITFGGGVRVAAGDISGDGYDDVIVAPGRGQVGLPVKVYSGQSVATGAHSPTVVSKLDPFPASYHGAINVTAGPLTSTAYDDVVVGKQTSGDTFAVYSGAALSSGSTTPLFTQAAWSANDMTGIKVALALDASGSGLDDLIVTNGAGSKTVRYMSANLTPTGWTTQEAEYFTALAGVTTPINVG